MLDRHLDANAGRGAHPGDQGVGQVTLAHAAAFGFHEDRPGGVVAAQRIPQQRLEALLRGLDRVGHQAEHRAAMIGQRLEVENLGAQAGQPLQDQALAAAGAPRHDAQAQGVGQDRQVGEHAAAEGPVAAVQHGGAPAHAGHDRGERARAVSAAPAVHQRAPLAGAVGELRFQDAGDVARDQRGADALGLERGLLLVDRAHAGALHVVQHGGGDRSGQAVFGVLGGAARIEDRVVAVERRERLVDADDDRVLHRGAIQGQGTGILSARCPQGRTIGSQGTPNR